MNFKIKPLDYETHQCKWCCDHERGIACTRWFRRWDGARNILFQYVIGRRNVRDDVRDVDRSVMCHYVCDGVCNILCNITRAMLSVL